MNEKTAKNENNKGWRHLIPAILVVGLVGIYVLFNSAFIKCPVGCQRIDGGLVSELNPDVAELSNATNKSNGSTDRLKKEIETFNNRNASRREKEEEIGNTQAAVTDKVREIANLKIVNANVDTNSQQ